MGQVQDAAIPNQFVCWTVEKNLFFVMVVMSVPCALIQKQVMVLVLVVAVWPSDGSAVPSGEAGGKCAPICVNDEAGAAVDEGCDFSNLV